MDFAYDEKTQELRERLLKFMDTDVFPAEAALHAPGGGGHEPFTRPAVIKDLQAKARELGLWNLFLPHDSRGGGLTNLQYAPLAEITGWVPQLAPEALNCNAPDTGNMEVLTDFGTPEQQERWLTPLLNAEIRSAFAMTEPDVASSDARNISTEIRREGDEYVINGRKWWTTGAMDPNCKIFIVMGKTNAGADVHHQQSMVLVPRDTPGLTVVRPLMVYGYDDADHGGHAEVRFDNVRVPVSNLIGEEGSGFAIAQARLGPGRIHHCMRAIGMAERAVELMCRRVVEREAFGKPLARQGVILQWIAQSRIRIESARLLILKTAWLMDTVGNKGAHTEIQAIKILTPEVTTWVLDRAVQSFGGAGVSQDTPLAALWAGARTLHLADGPDEVHEASLGRREIKKYLV
jgi:acyl-CoA dehydrogenase